MLELFLGLVLALAAHDRGAQDVPAPTWALAGPAPVAPPAGHARPQPPLTLQVEGPATAAAGQTVTLQVLVDSRLPPGRQVTVDLTLPAGVTLTQGDARTVLDQPGRHPLTYQLRLAALPDGDVTVVAQAGDSGWGVTARGHYRFGRSEVPPPVPARGPAIRIHGKPLGRPIPLR